MGGDYNLQLFFFVSIFDNKNWMKVKCLLATLLGQQDGVDVGQDTSSSNGDSSEQLVQFLVVLDGKGDVTGHNTRLLVVTSSVSCKFQNLSAQVLQDGSKVYWGSGSHTGGVLSLTEVTTDTTDRELQTCLGRRGCGLLFSTASLSFSFSCRIEELLLENDNIKQTIHDLGLQLTLLGRTRHD